VVIDVVGDAVVDSACEVIAFVVVDVVNILRAVRTHRVVRHNSFVDTCI
jgi:hypothetical protein